MTRQQLSLFKPAALKKTPKPRAKRLETVHEFAQRARLGPLHGLHPEPGHCEAVPTLCYILGEAEPLHKARTTPRPAEIQCRACLAVLRRYPQIANRMLQENPE